MSRCPACGSSNPTGSRFCNACGARLETPREASGERRVVTMLFCDVRGSTAMAETLDAEEWTDIMNEAFERLIAPVDRYEGTVARLMGDAILAFFGAPSAHEDDPQRAVMAGLEIVVSIGPLRERLARERGLDLNVRVGINTGPVVVGEVGSEIRQEYSAMGDAVNVAARMEQTAEPGTVQITEDTYRLVADLFDVDPLGGIELKGKREPVSAYRVIGRRPGPWKTRAAPRPMVPVVGRATEMAVVRSALEDARRGLGSVVMLVGEPGIGKSRLVEEANAQWSAWYPEDERRWDLWQCVPFDAMQPYAQYRRNLREFAGIVGSDTAEVVRDKIAALMRFVPQGWEELSERVARALLGVELPDEPRLEGEEFRRAAIEIAGRSTLAERGSRLMVFEDLHWCDLASLDLVQETTRLAEDAPFAVLLTFRPDRSAASWRLKQWVETELPHRSRLVELEPLTREESDELIDELIPVEGMPGEIREQILAAAEGNPLFLHEVARALVDRGIVERDDDGGWRVASGVTEVAIPDTVQSLIVVGLDRLPEDVRRTLQVASVIGRDFDEELLAAVAGDGDVRRHLRELERRGLIHVTERVPMATYSFHHALTQEAAYGTLLMKRRRDLHRRVAEALEIANAERPEEVAPLLVQHYVRAVDDEATLRAATAAAAAAARLYANAEAEAHYRTAIDAGRRLGSGASVLEPVYLGRGTALELSGRYEDTAANYEEMSTVARELGDEAMQLAADTAFALLYSTATPLFDPDRGRRLAEDVVEAARRLGDRAAEARALWSILVAEVYGGDDQARAVEAGEAAFAIARELGDREQVAFTLQDLCRAYVALGDRTTAVRRLAEARELWEELGNRPMLSENLTLTSMERLFQGDHRAALTEAEEALSISRSIENRWGQAYALISRYRAELDLGQVGAAMRSMQDCLEIGEGSGFTFAGVASRVDLARTLVELGDSQRALALADRALELARRQLPPAVPPALVARAEALLAAGERGDARSVLDTVDPERLPGPDRTFSFVIFKLAGSRAELALDRPGAAASAAADALGYLRSNGIQVMVAEGLVAMARARLAEGRLAEAEGASTEATEEAERLGERRALWEALAISAKVRELRGTPDEAAELRERARGVVGEIAEGLDDDGLRESFLERTERELAPEGSTA